MTGGSQQLRLFRRALRDGLSIEQAAADAGMPIAEAKLTAAEDAKNPPPEEAYQLLGHNSGASMTDNVSAAQLRQFIERIERLEEEKQAFADDIKDVYAEAKATGFDPKAMRVIIRDRKLEKHVRDERDAILDTYRSALGMLSDTPLGAYALSRAE